MLFLNYFNDIVNNISCNIKLFADDTSLYLVVDNEYEAAEQLNKYIESIHQLSHKWLIKFNPDKTEIMTISKKKHHKPHHLPVYMDNVISKEVETDTHLGLTISEDGNWNEHVKYILIKVSSRLSVFRRVKI
jgi:hypothetical protein